MKKPSTTPAKRVPHRSDTNGTVTFSAPKALIESIRAAAKAENRAVANWMQVHLPALLDEIEARGKPHAVNPPTGAGMDVTVKRARA